VYSLESWRGHFIAPMPLVDVENQMEKVIGDGSTEPGPWAPTLWSDWAVFIADSHQTGGPGATSASRWPAHACWKIAIGDGPVHHRSVHSEGPVIFIIKNTRAHYLALQAVLCTRTRSDAPGYRRLRTGYCLVSSVRHQTLTIDGPVRPNKLQWVLSSPIFLLLL
jgi:hypothetical protein